MGMKTIAIRQPWALFVALGEKTIENRTRPTRYRGRLLIHASKATDSETLETVEQLRRAENAPEIEWTTGAIIGCVTLVDCVTESDSEWFTGPHGYVLEDAILFDRPVPARGQLGIYETPFITVEMAAAILGKKPVTVRAGLQRLGIGRKMGRDYLIDDNDLAQLESVPAPGRPVAK